MGQALGGTCGGTEASGSGDAAAGGCGCERRRRFQRGAAGDDRLEQPAGGRGGR